VSFLQNFLIKVDFPTAIQLGKISRKKEKEKEEKEKKRKRRKRTIMSNHHNSEYFDSFISIT